jgi:hypothetical protein
MQNGYLMGVEQLTVFLSIVQKNKMLSCYFQFHDLFRLMVLCFRYFGCRVAPVPEFLAKNPKLFKAARLFEDIEGFSELLSQDFAPAKPPVGAAPPVPPQPAVVGPPKSIKTAIGGRPPSCGMLLKHSAGK